ncbi:lipopolysaccharide biosynthesis protein [Deinococcus rubellus]|uniref:Uncharacterized protein n=1 Tax=Deinococcus rubellus TaxID=1889240 RepID=A0ABY5YDQ6_9DEIO|nr:oligosaccharide flippase family protein [Deinococcus rubellus]UWX63153.1 hypothetical protein N0D28_10340 [Deinococcus rubellus]
MIPLIGFPILVRKLGLQSYGEMIIHLLIWQSVCMILDYNYNSLGVQKVLACDGNERRIVSLNLFLSKIYLFSLGIIIFLLASVFYFYNEEKLFIVFGIAYLFGYLMTNQMWFSVNEKFYLLAFINFISKFVFLIGIFAFISDLRSVLMIQALSLLISGFLSVFITKYPREFSISDTMYRDGFLFLKETYPAFSANFSGYILSNVPLYLGPMLLSPSNFGIYSLIDRIVRVFLAVYSAINQVLFRKTLSMVLLGISQLREYILRILVLIVPLYILICGFGILVSIYVSPLLFHVNLKNYLPYFVQLSAWSIFSVVNSILGYHYLQSLQKYREYGNIMAVSLILTILFTYLFGKLYAIGGMVSGMVLSEVIILFILLHIYVTKRGI